eukprot:6942330-Lingulodinium_polyedra.AAC.1
MSSLRRSFSSWPPGGGLLLEPAPQRCGLIWPRPVAVRRLENVSGHGPGHGAQALAQRSP